MIYELSSNQRAYSRSKKVNIDFYPMTQSLYDEIERIGILDRIKDIPQLGIIKTKKRLLKSRYDYLMLQFYFHKIIKKNINGKLKYSYASKVSPPGKDGRPIQLTVANVIQLLIIVYNIGHFYNTFTESRAVVMLAEENSGFADMLKKTIPDSRFTDACNHIFQANDYHRMHLLNSLMILEHCDSSLQSVELAKDILYEYLFGTDDDKMNYVFWLFRNVRNMSYIAFDLQISNAPFILDICNESSMLVFFEELLSEFNNRQSSVDLVNSFQKLLDDTIYNNSENIICYYSVSKKMKKELAGNAHRINSFYYELFLDAESVLNKGYTLNHDYDKDNILKLTFSCTERNIARQLLKKFESANHIRAGYYDRYSGETTIIVSISNRCENKIKASFNALSITISFLRRIQETDAFDVRYLLTVKFFLKYRFDGKSIYLEFEPDNKKCVSCSKGTQKRINYIRKLKDALDDDDTKHELDFMIRYLSDNMKNEVTISVPASTSVRNDGKSDQICEFDGIIIFPNRNEKQIVLLEAKNTKEKPSFGKKCLGRKLKKLHIPYEQDKIIIAGYDAYIELSV